MGSTINEIWQKFIENFPQAIGETIYMCLVSTFLAFIFGLILAIFLIITARDGLSPMPKIYKILDIFTNTLRSFPFIILIIAIVPITRFFAGTSLGTTASIVPLTIGAAPFIARLLESSFKEIDKSMIEAAKSFGATNSQIIFKIILVESLPNIISTITMALIVIVGFSAMAGAVGGGGVGALAINRGYNGFDDEILYLSVVILLIMVQIVQSIGDYLYKITKK